MKLRQQLVIEPDPYSVTKNAHALAVLTERSEFRDLDYAKTFHQMQQTAFAFDGRNILDSEELRKFGFHVYALGKPVVPWSSCP